MPVGQKDYDGKFSAMPPQNIENGCPNLLTCASTSLQCPAPMICVDFWKVMGKIQLVTLLYNIGSILHLHIGFTAKTGQKIDGTKRGQLQKSG